MATFTGTPRNDTWTVVQAATFTLDGLDGVDTLSLGTSLRSAYTISRAPDGAVLVDSVSGASGPGLHATLYNLELLTFNSGRDTVDLRTFFGDVTAPTLQAVTPQDDATGVAVNASLVLSFSEAVTRGSGTVQVKDSSGAVVASYDAATSPNLVFAGQTLTIDPSTDFAAGRSYSVSIPAGAVRDSSGNAYAGLSGYNFTTVAQALTGSAGPDTLTPGSGLTNVDGGAGIDTVVLGQARAAWVLRSTESGFTLTGATTTVALTQVERLQFPDQKLALDLGGHAGTVVKVLGAVFGAASVQNAAYVGIGLKLADEGMSAEALMQLALDARLGAGASHSAVVQLLYTNVVGVAPSASELASFVALLDTRTHTPATLGLLAAETSLNTAAIDLVGLSASGVVYSG